MRLLVCGHRLQKLGRGISDHSFHAKVKKALQECVLLKEPDLVYTGMAIGTDQWAAEICVDHNIPFIAAVPFKEQYTRWPKKVQDHYHFLLKRATEVIQVDRQLGYINLRMKPGKYASSKLFNRNKWMVQQLTDGDSVIAVMNNRVSGTAHTVQMTFSKHISLSIIQANTLRVSSYDPNYSSPGSTHMEQVHFLDLALAN